MILNKILNYLKFSFIAIVIFLFLVASSCKAGSSEETDITTDDGEVMVEEEEEEDSISTGIPDMELISNLKIPGQAIDACISGDYVYLTSDLGILYIINVSDRSNPVIEGKCRETESPNIVIAKGDYAYVSYTDIIYENNDYSTKCGFYIIDVSDKTNPELIGNYDTGENKKKTALGLFVEGGYAYIEIADEEEQEDVSFLEIVDISNKRNPEIFSKYEIEGIATGIWVKNNIAFMNVNFYSNDEDSDEGESRLVTVDLEDKKNPEIMDDCSVNYNSSSVYSIGDLAFVTSWQLDKEIENYINSKIEVLDIENPYDIKLVGECKIPGGAWEMDSGYNFIYVTSLSGKLFAIDVEDKEDPYIFDSLDTGGTSYDISIEGEYGYISDGFEGLNIVDLSSDSGEIDMNGESEESVDDYYGNYPPEAFIEIYGDIFKENYFQVKILFISLLKELWTLMEMS